MVVASRMRSINYSWLLAVWCSRMYIMRVIASHYNLRADLDLPSCFFSAPKIYESGQELAGHDEIFQLSVLTLTLYIDSSKVCEIRPRALKKETGG